MFVKDLKEWCKDKKDTDKVVFCTYNWDSEAYTTPVDVELKISKPKPTDFKHKECKHYEIINVKGKDYGYCNRLESFIEIEDWESCEDFEHNTSDVDYCLECRICYAHYKCEALKKNR